MTRHDGIPVVRRLFRILWIMAVCGIPQAPGATDLVVVVGAPGAEEFGEAFAEAAAQWKIAGEQGGAAVTMIGREDDGGGDLRNLRDAMAGLDPESSDPLWIVLLGHGTFDGREAKFNLRGEDLGAVALGDMLKETTRPVAVINTSSSSAPFVAALSKENRVIVTATKSGFEDSFTRFGGFLAGAIVAREADIDQDGATSLVEAFIAASKQVEEFYEKEGRIATEEALLDDNGDGRGTPADWFRGVRATKTAKDGAEPDGFRAHQFHLVPSEEERRLPPEVRRRRDALEQELLGLRARKDEMPEDEYYRKLEEIARRLASLYAATEDADDS
jgi:hypothetical protein